MDTSEKMPSADRNKTSAVTATCASDTHDQAHIPLPDPFVQRLRLLDEQSRIDSGRNDRQTRGECSRIAAHAHAHHERRHRSRRRRVKHIRQLVAFVVGIQAEVAHDAHDLEPLVRRLAPAEGRLGSCG